MKALGCVACGDESELERSASADFPPVLLHGGIPAPAVPVRTDYLTVTAPIPDSSDVDLAASLVAIVQAGVGDAWGKSENREKGLLGYEHSIRWEHGGAVAAWGGQRDTAMVSIPGEACELVQDWPRLVAALRDAFGGRITRWDGAADDYDGAHTVEDAAAGWLAGSWTGRGRPPGASQAGNWLRPDGRGRTLYVGSRKNGKMARVYEKGKQLGDPSSPWVRWEVELHRIDREIPWECVTNPRPYIAGSYPAMRWVSAGGPSERIRTSRPAGIIALDTLIRNAGLAYGRLVDTLLRRGVSERAVIDVLRRPGIPARLACDELHRLRDADKWVPSPMPAWFVALRQRAAIDQAIVRIDAPEPVPDGLADSAAPAWPRL